jgi:hypothetical protein
MKCLLKHKSTNYKLLNNKTCAKFFSHIYHNFPAVSHYYYNGKLTNLDTFANDYDKYIVAYLHKRWTLKQEIPPRVKILNTKKAFGKVLQNQKIDRKFTNLPEEILRYQYDNGFINRNYIFNILLEKNEIDLYKAVVDKVIVSGYTVKLDDYNDFMNIKDNVDKLVNVFFNGDELTELDKVLELLYIKEKKNRLQNSPKFITKNNTIVFTDNDYKKYITTFGYLNELKDKLNIDIEDKYIFNKVNWGLMLETLQMMGYSNRNM